MNAAAEICLRVDAGGVVGLGHYARCASLARELQRRGKSVAFAGRIAAWLHTSLPSAANRFFTGEPDASPLTSEDGEQTAAWAEHAVWLVVDHLGANADWATAVRRRAPRLRILVVDDHQRREWADLRLAPTQLPAPHTLAGPTWLPIDPAFAAARNDRPRSGIVIYFSSHDPNGLCRRAITALRPLVSTHALTVICADAAAARDGLDALLRAWPAGGRRIAEVQPGTMAAILAQAAVVVCSASTIAWEALACGTPVAAVFWIDNQEASAARLAELGVPIASDPESVAARIPALLGAKAPAFSGDGVGRLANHLITAGCKG
ncbi:MAG: hypothetical protein AAB263_12115 [Planctomycetota bacterium]